MAENDLVALARQFAADKREATLNAYERYFRDFRGSATSVLEIGVKRGGSLQAWAAYFPMARVVGLDLRAPKVDLGARVEVVVGDQGDPAVLEALAEARGPFDVVIDDGSHILSHQQMAFDTLWPHVKPGGVFVVEDIHTSYKERYQEPGVVSTVDFLTAKMAPFIQSVGETDIDSIAFGYMTAFVVKRCAAPSMQTFLKARLENKPARIQS